MSSHDNADAGIVSGSKRFYFDPPRRKSKTDGAGLKSLLVRCPATSRLTNTGRTIEEKSWPAAEIKPQTLTCPHCGALHNWTKADVVLGNLQRAES